MYTIETLPALIETALQKASTAANDHIEKYGHHDACGFAWVVVHEKGSTKLGRALLKLGFRKSYGGGLEYWNPSRSYTQNMTALEQGARAFANVLRDAGITAYASSRMD